MESEVIVGCLSGKFTVAVERKQQGVSENKSKISLSYFSDMKLDRCESFHETSDE